MKSILSILILLSTSLLLSSTYSTKEASRHIGEQTTICGTVYSGYYAQNSRGKPTFINLDGRYPNQKFTVVIWGNNRHKFRSPEKQYNGKRICVTGIIDSYRGIPQIDVSNKGQIR